MSTEELPDDYVADLLKNDAKASSARYTAVGLQAYLPTRCVAYTFCPFRSELTPTHRPTGQAPKPNTRFLRNILRETDSHNAALLAKEAEESRARLKSLRGGGQGSAESSHQSQHVDRRSRIKRRREESDTESDRRRRYDERSSHRSHRSKRDTSADRDDLRRGEKRSRRLYESDDERDHGRSRHSHRSRRHRDKSASENDNDRHERRRSHKHRNRSRSAGSRERRHRETSDDQGRRRKHRRRRSPSSSPKARDRQVDGSDSDPLEAIVGPAPAPPPSKVRVRGRGAVRASSTMDAHFAADYDPSQDVQPDSGEDDWEMAIEALRDRQRWRQQGAERLKAAGFTDEEVKKWEKGGEKTEEDVRWRKKGEGREWDRGKVVDEDGHVDIRAEWGRLKGT